MNVLGDNYFNPAPSVFRLGIFELIPVSVRMVDIGDKDVVYREASAQGRILLSSRTLNALREGRIEKGDVLTVSKAAGLHAAKLTSQLFPLCHQIPLNKVSVELTLGRKEVKATSTVSAYYRTGVEMEALVAVSAALLNVWDMVKKLEKDAGGQYPMTRVTDIAVTSKKKLPVHGGTTGAMKRHLAPRPIRRKP